MQRIGHHLDAKVSDLQDMTHSNLRTSGDLISMQKISAEAVYLQNIMSELRDHADQKKVLGVVVDDRLKLESATLRCLREPGDGSHGMQY